MNNSVITPVRRVKTWAPVPTAVRRLQESSEALRYVGATVSHRSSRGDRRRGQVLWEADIGQAHIGLAWEWTRLHGNVVVITDPMRVASNVALVDDESGTPLSESEALCCLNGLIHSLPWQEKLKTTM